MLFLGTFTASVHAVTPPPTVTVYTSEAAYNAAQEPDVTIEFDGQVTSPSSTTNLGDPGTLTIGGVTFDANTSMYVIGPDVASQYDFPSDGTATLDAQATTDAVVTANLPTGSALPVDPDAVGTQIADAFKAASITVDVTVAGDATPFQYVLSAPDGDTSGLGFVGFISQSGAITSVSYTDGSTGASQDLAIDNFTYGYADAVPEPTSLSLLALGAGALFFMRRRLSVR